MKTEPNESKDIHQALSQMQLQMPFILEEVSHAFGIVVGKDRKLPSASKIENLNRSMEQVLEVAEEIELLKNQEITPVKAVQLLSLLNRFFRLLSPNNIPEDVEPVDYVVSLMRDMVSEPIWEPFLQESNCSEKYQSFYQFIRGLVQTVDEEKLSGFFEETAAGYHLVPQFQRAFNKMSLPKELDILPKKDNVKAAEKLKTGLRLVLADWEGFVNLVYGLVLLKEGKGKSWDEIRSVSLWDKVAKVRNDEFLTPLATAEWVTVRNALDHGTAFFNPTDRVIQFKDKIREVSWGLQRTRAEGLGIFVSNFVIMGTWVFMNAERSKELERIIKHLRILSRSENGLSNSQ